MGKKTPLLHVAQWSAVLHELSCISPQHLAHLFPIVGISDRSIILKWLERQNDKFPIACIHLSSSFLLHNPNAYNRILPVVIADAALLEFILLKHKICTKEGYIERRLHLYVNPGALESWVSLGL